MAIKALNYAPDAWKFLNGVFCVYKPAGLSSNNVRRTLILNLCRDLNELNQREIRKIVCLKGSVCLNKPYEVEMLPNYADHELVSGPHYQEQDVRMKCVYTLGRNISGVFLMAVNNGCWLSSKGIYRNFLHKYEIKGKFGIATKNFMSDGIVIEKSTYSHVKQISLDRILASIQRSHQSLAYKCSGIDIQTQDAYNAAASGIIKPSGKSSPIVYSIKCTEFNLPYFTLEVHCINETEFFLLELIHDIGIDLRTNAVCLQLRQIQFGPFTLPHALLRKHWTLENILTNLTLCQTVLSQNEQENCHFVRALKNSNVIENIQQKVREEEI